MKFAETINLKPWLKKHATRKRIAVAAACAVVIGAGFWFIFGAQREDTVTDSSGTVTYSTDTPSEVKPGNDYAWKGGPNDPKKITINSANIDGFIQNVGVDQRKQIAVPNNVFIGGWFTDSVRPGAKGLSIIDGHVNGRKQDGAIFQKLPKVNDGDKVVVEFGNGSKKTFTVFETHDVSLADSHSILFSQDPTVSNQLNLITCVGTFDKKANTYDKRFIVYTKLDS